MRSFGYHRAKTYEEAAQYIKTSSKTVSVISGGTDFLNIWRDQIISEDPDEILQVDQTEGAEEVEELEEGWRIGAGVRLSTAAKLKNIPLLAKAASSIATEQIRNTATIAGNLFQDVSCPYYRYTDFMGGRMVCRRKGGDLCCAMHGGSSNHSLFGGMITHSTPCTLECPLKTDISAYTQEIRNGNIKKAAEILMQENPFPMLLSRVCPHPCEKACNQNRFGDGISIHNLERFLGDYILEHRDKFYFMPRQESGKKIAVVGAGPGGMSAAYYLRKSGHRVTVFEKAQEAGGVMRYGIPHYRLPKQYLDEVIEGLEEMGISFRMNTSVGKDIHLEDLLEDFDFVFLSTGAWKQPVLGIGHEEVAEFGLNFLNGVNRFLRKNISGRILVCGGGNVAMDAALTAVRLGAQAVTLICLEQEIEMPASPEEIARCREEGVEICCGWGLQEIVTDTEGKPKGMLAKRCISVYDEHHHFSPQYLETETQLFPADTIILATGQRVDISFLGTAFQQNLSNPRGLIDTEVLTGKTRHPRIFAGGDAATGPNIASRAVASGKKAAIAICNEIGMDNLPKSRSAGTFTTINPYGIQLTTACQAQEKELGERTLYGEDSITPNWDEIMRESERCMNCSCFAVNSSDLAPVLLLLEAIFVTTDRNLSAKELLTSCKSAKDVLNRGELLKEIWIKKQEFDSFFFEKSETEYQHEKLPVSLASGISLSNGCVIKAKFVFGGVAGIPYEAKETENYLQGKKLDKETIEYAAEEAVRNACVLPDNRERLRKMKQLFRRALYCLL